MSGRTLTGVAVAALASLAGLAWWLTAEQRPRVVEPGTPLPVGEKVEMRFHDAETGETDTWKLEKKETTREESLQKAELPEPDPARAGHVPLESARALDGQALEAWKQGNIEDAMKSFEAAIAADPDDRVPRSHYGRLLTLAADFERAKPQLERAAQLAPEDPQVWLDLQTLYERSLLLDQAFEARRRAEELAGGRAITQNEMGCYEVEGSPSFP